MNFVIGITSWKKRINFGLNKVIESILKSKTNYEFKIVLTLSTDEFSEGIPSWISEIDDPRFELNLIKENIKSYKKLIPVLDKYPDLPIMCWDDDILMHENFIQDRFTEYLKFPQFGLASFAYRLLPASDGVRLAGCCEVSTPHFDIMEFSGSGAIYPPHCYQGLDGFTNSEEYLSICPSDDEAWFWAWRLVSGVRFRWIKFKEIPNERSLYYWFLKDAQGPGISLNTLNSAHTRISAVFQIASKHKEIRDKLTEMYGDLDWIIYARR